MKKLELNKKQIEKLLEITESNIVWFESYYPNEEHNFADLLRRNYMNLYNYLVIDLMGEYDNEIINNKLSKMSCAFDFLFDISNNKKIDT